MSVDGNDDEIFEVEKILDHTITPDGKYNTWEPEENLYCPLLKDAYHKQRGKAEAVKAAKDQRNKVQKIQSNSGGAPRKHQQKRPKSTIITPTPRPPSPAQSLRPSQPRRPVLTVKLSLPKPITTQPSMPRAEETTPLQRPIPSKRPRLTVKLSLPKPTTQPPLTSTAASVNIPLWPEAPTPLDLPAPTQTMAEPANSSFPQLVVEATVFEGGSTHRPANLNVIRPIKYPTGSRSSNKLRRQHRDSPDATLPVYAKNIGHSTSPSPPSIRKTSFGVPPLSPTRPTKSLSPVYTSPTHSVLSTSPSSSYAKSTDQTPNTPIATTTAAIKGYGSYTLQFHTSHDPHHLDKEALLFIRASDLIATTVLPARLIKHLFKDGDCCMMEILPPDTCVLNQSKLHKFLLINEQAAVLRSPKQPNAALVLHAANGPLCAMFIKNVVVPKSAPLPAISQLNQAWQYVANILMFPASLCHLLHHANVEVFGSSALADLVRSAVRCRAKGTRAVLLFDRKDGLLYRTPLYDRTDVWIYEFGISSPVDPITPALEAYPKDTGGYITTDIGNMLQDPTILDKMVELMQKRNAAGPGSWQVVLPADFLSHIMRSGTGATAQCVISKILLFMDSNLINVLENWREIGKENDGKASTLDWFNTVAQTHLHTYQAFDFVDDAMNFTDLHTKYPSIHFVQSKDHL